MRPAFPEDTPVVIDLPDDHSHHADYDGERGTVLYTIPDDGQTEYEWLYRIALANNETFDAREQELRHTTQ